MSTLVFVSLYTDKHNHLSILTDQKVFLQKWRLNMSVYASVCVLAFFKDNLRYSEVLFSSFPSCVVLLCSELQHLAWFNKSMFVLKLKMRAGGMSESSKWKKQKRSPRPPRHMVRSPSGQMDPAQSSTLTNNLSGIPSC